MEEKTLFPREEKSEILFKKISEDKWACEKLMETFCSYLFSNDGVDLPDSPSSTEFAQALFNSYRNRDLSAFLMAICQNTVFDLLRNAFLIPYRFNADGKQNPMIMTDENGMLLPEYKRSIHEREYRHFHEVYTDLGAPKNIFLAQAYRYSHSYTSDDMEPEQNILEKNNGVLLIRELPDTVKLKETEAEAYSAILDIVIKLQKELPMSYVFYGQDSLVEDNTRYDEIGVFLPNSHFLKNLLDLLHKHILKHISPCSFDNYFLWQTFQLLLEQYDPLFLFVDTTQPLNHD